MKPIGEKNGAQAGCTKHGYGARVGGTKYGH